MSLHRECLVMAKPAGPLCNMRCRYCYYLGKESLFPLGLGRTDDEILERYISQRLQTSPGPVTHFEWHGGEPTLLGLEYFGKIVNIQKKCLPPGRTVTNGLQTNGLLLDEQWAGFLAREEFSVGLSLDGPAGLHDVYRRTAEGAPTHDRVVTAFRLLKVRKVFCNVLCVLHAKNASKPDELYDFFKSIGVTHLQFLPVVSPMARGGVSPVTASPEVIGAFLCRIFDRWIQRDVGRIVIQSFDEALRPIYGVPHALCVHRETCGDVAVLEHDGGFYACDHFVDSRHFIGNLRERSLAELASDPRMIQFGKAKKDSLPLVCLGCDVLSSCNGGCPKDRVMMSPDGEAGLNYLCPAYQRFFRHSKPILTRLAAHMKAGLPLRGFSTP